MDRLSDHILVLDLVEVEHVKKMTASMASSANDKSLSAAADFP